MNQVRPESAAPFLRIDAQDFRGNMTESLRRARQGASFLITSDGEVAAPKQPRRLVGAMRGQIWMADDFDTWPEGFIEEVTEGAILPPQDRGE